jgi:hypothetical protein
MPLTKQQKIYCGVLALAAAAWLGDRFILGGETTAPHPAAARSLAVDRPAGAAGAAAPNAAPAVSLAGKFLNFAEKAEKDPERPGVTADAFAPPPHWLQPPAKQTPLATKAAPQAIFDVEQFRREHKLTAVLRGGRNDLAVIDGTLIQVGQRIGTFQLVSLTETTATVTVAGTTVTLVLERPADVRLPAAVRP